MATREAIVTALLAKLSATGVFITIGRRARDPENAASVNAPALMLVTDSETYDRPSPSLPPKRTMHMLALVYCDVGTNQNAIPDTILNNIKDALDAALVPDNLASGRCTLGGLVYSAMIDGEIKGSPGERTGKGLAIVPIEIVLP